MPRFRYRARGPRGDLLEGVLDGATQDAVRQLRGCPSGTVVAAERQTAGRGRQGRSWHSGEGLGLAFSVLLRPPPPAARWAWIPIALGLAMARRLAGLLEAQVLLKFPNDLVDASGRKLSKQYRDAPVDPGQPLDALLQALDFLGQELPPERPDNLADFWRWAIAQWSLEKVPAQPKIPLSTNSS